MVGLAGHRGIEVSRMQKAHNQLSADAPSGSERLVGILLIGRPA